MNRLLILGVLMMVVLVGGVLGQAPVSIYDFGGSSGTSGTTSTVPIPLDPVLKPGELTEEQLKIIGLKKVTMGTDFSFTKFDEGGAIITIKKDGSFKYTENGVEREFRNLKAKSSTFEFRDGKLVRASFQLTGDSKILKEYRLGDYTYSIPMGSDVVFKRGDDNSDGTRKKDIVIITQPNESEVKPPLLIDSDNKNPSAIEIEYQSKGNSLKLPNQDLIKKYGEGKLGLSYDAKYKAFVLKDAAVIANLEVGSLEKSDTHLFFDRNKIPNGFEGAYLFLNSETKEMELFASEGKDSSTVRFKGKEGYGGVDARETDVFIIQALGKGKTIEGKKTFTDKKGLINIKPQGKGVSTLVHTEGSFTILDGNRLIRYNPELENGIRIWPNIKDVKDSDIDFSKATHVAVQINPRDSSNKMLKYKGKDGKKDMNFDIFIDKKGYMRTDAGKDADKKVLSKVQLGSLNNIEMTKLNRLPFSEQMKLFGKDVEDIKKFLDSEEYNKLIQGQESQASDLSGGSQTGQTSQSSQTGQQGGPNILAKMMSVKMDRTVSYYWTRAVNNNILDERNKQITLHGNKKVSMKDIEIGIGKGSMSGRNTIIVTGTNDKKYYFCSSCSGGTWMSL